MTAVAKIFKNVWEHMFDKLDEFSDEYMKERVQPKQNRESIMVIIVNEKKILINK